MEIRYSTWVLYFEVDNLLSEWYVNRGFELAADGSGMEDSW